MIEISLTAININQESCSKCAICHSICPFEAINRDEETGKVEIDLQKCQVCGICYSSCPAMAISIVYYDYDNLLKRIKEMREKNMSDTLVLMCRGSSPSSGEVSEILKEKELEANNYIHLRLPCAGRIPAEFIFKLVNAGIKRIISVQCEDHFCRFKEGTKINTRRMLLSQKLFDYIGLGKDTYTVIKHARKAVYDTAKCVGCDKCVFICPYDAIEAGAFATPNIDLDKCMGCGACALVCPHEAIEVKGFEFNNILKLYMGATNKLKAQSNSPLILVLACQWSEFPALDQPNSPFSRKGTIVTEVPCFKALDPVHIVNALRNGFDGVMAAVCPPEDCKLEEGKETAERNVDVLKKALKSMGLLQRFELFNVHPRSVSQFCDQYENFYNRIAEMKQSTR